MALAAPEHLESAVHQALAVHARADADLVQQIDADLLEDAGTDAAEHVLAGLALDDHGVDARLGQELPEQQARRSGADDGDLRRLRDACSPPWSSHGSIPWRRFASAAAGEAMKRAAPAPPRAGASARRRPPKTW